jgi:hypothetical protein
LFGETEKERRLRLRALELLEERDGKAGGGTNEFKKALEEAQKAMEYRDMDNRGKGKGKGRDGDGQDGEEDGGDASNRTGRREPEILDLELVKSEPKKVYPLIYYALKVGPGDAAIVSCGFAENGLVVTTGMVAGLGRILGRPTRRRQTVSSGKKCRRYTGSNRTISQTALQGFASKSKWKPAHNASVYPATDQI